MTPTLALFYAAALCALGSVGMALRSREPRLALRWFAVTLAAVAAIELLLLAPWVAIAAATAGAVVLAVFGFIDQLGRPAGEARPRPRERRSRRRLELLLGLLLVAAIAWILLGTWGRQLAFPGHDLAPGSAFGGLGQLAAAAEGERLALAFALPLLIFAGALGALSLVDRAQAERG
jgi:NADH:ubiquinone oxidoreductase subunit 6 (subunit J)